MIRPGLTAIQSRLLDFLIEREDSGAGTPTYQDMADVLDCGKTNIHRLVEGLQARGDIERLPRQPRSIRVARKDAANHYGALAAKAWEARALRAEAALTKIAAFDDEVASAALAETGKYLLFDEPASAKIAREALAMNGVAK